MRKLSVTLSYLLLTLLLFLFAATIIGGYKLNWVWTGFGPIGSASSIQFEPAKTLWDWLDLFLIPTTIAAAGLLLNHAERATERLIAQENQYETRLQSYLQRMSELMLENDLVKSKIDEEVRSLAQAQTLATMRSIDPNRRVFILRFLYLSKLIDLSNPIIRLDGTDMSNADLSGLNLSYANLANVNFEKAQLDNAELRGSNLTLSNLTDANLKNASLQYAILNGATLSKTNLSRTRLENAELNGAILKSAILKASSLEGAKLIGADLGRANLYLADLRYADLTNANLSKAFLFQTILTKSYMFGVNMSWAIVLRTDLEKAVLINVKYSFVRQGINSIIIKLQGLFKSRKVAIYDEETGQVVTQEIGKSRQTTRNQ